MRTAKSSFKFIFGNSSHRGQVREVNEDYFGNFSTANGYVFIVCDGMGGHVGGERASRIAVDAIKDFLINNTYDDVREALHGAIVFANDEIIKYAEQSPELRGMGTTCVVLLVKGSLVYYGYVGDSRIYHIADSQIIRLTKDHSFVQCLVDMGGISEEEAENHPRKNEITNALGLRKMKPAVCERPIQALKDDYFLLCTDGLTGLVNDDAINSIVNENLSLQEKAERLVKLANDAGGTDNITVQLVQFTASSYRTRNSNGIYKQNRKQFHRFLLFGVIAIFIIAAGLIYFSQPLQKPEVPAGPKNNNPDATVKRDTAVAVKTPDSSIKNNAAESKNAKISTTVVHHRKVDGKSATTHQTNRDTSSKSDKKETLQQSH